MLVELDTIPTTYRVGLITKPIDANGEYKMSYMRKMQETNQFTFLDEPDIASVRIDCIKVILDLPSKCGTTKRQNSNLRFVNNFENLFVH